MNNFLNDVKMGLQSNPKHLDSKYFYDKKGDELFKKIMSTDEYYLTGAEMEIFKTQSSDIADKVLSGMSDFDLVEFGPGDAIKSMYLLKEFVKRNAIRHYFPIDISENIIEMLRKYLPEQIPSLEIQGFAGEYLEMLSRINQISSEQKLILFLGANIGNFKLNEIPQFFQKLRGLLGAGDKILIGFDLKKNPGKILNAYNDKSGFTKAFNLNILSRINNELGGNFDTTSFEHFPVYDPISGACKSYLISTKKQTVNIDGFEIDFKKNEPLLTEVSQKYSLKEIDEIAVHCGFSIDTYFFDKNEYFTDVLLTCFD